MANTNLGFDHIHLLSKNPQATADWYSDKLGASVVKSVTVGGAPQIYVRFDGFIVIVRGQRDGESGVDKTSLEWGIDHFGLRVTGDFDRFCNDLRKKSVSFILEPMDFNATTRIAFIRAPDGVSVELVSRRAEP